MAQPRGRSMGISRGRNLVWDMMHFSRSVPAVVMEREISIPEVAAARLAADPKPSWYPVLLKAFSLAAMKIPALRTSLLTVPYTRLYEHACTVASVTVERELDGEPAVFLFNIHRPENKPLTEIDARFYRAKTAPIHEIADIRRTVLHTRLPWPVRRLVWWLGLRVSGMWRQKYWGTFSATSVFAAGGSIVATLTPLSSLFTFDAVKPNGSVMLRLQFDHRVYDGATAARGLVEMEKALRGEILQELRSMARPLRLAV